jgi:hypothetical protein
MTKEEFLRILDERLKPWLGDRERSEAAWWLAVMDYASGNR